MLDSEIPRLFHGFSGSYETFRQLLKSNSFFSFSNRELGHGRNIEIIKKIPVDKILIESDMLNTDYERIGHTKYCRFLEESMSKISLIKSISLDEFNSIILDNFYKFSKGVQS